MNPSAELLSPDPAPGVAGADRDSEQGARRPTRLGPPFLGRGCPLLRTKAPRSRPPSCPAIRTAHLRSAASLGPQTSLRPPRGRRREGTRNQAREPGHRDKNKRKLKETKGAVRNVAAHAGLTGPLPRAPTPAGPSRRTTPAAVEAERSPGGAHLRRARHRLSRAEATQPPLTCPRHWALCLPPGEVVGPSPHLARPRPRIRPSGTPAPSGTLLPRRRFQALPT